jgi:hypothetical protein
MKTAVKWLEEELKIRYDIYNSEPLFNQAKEMEKQQIEDAWNSAYGGDSNHAGEQYYTETIKP